MSFAFQRRRGTTAQHSTFTGLLAELTVDTDKDTVIVHDGTTAGGFPLARESRGVLTETVTRGLEEDVNVVASAATGTINFDFATASIWYYTSNATANHTLNLRYSGSATLNNNLAVNDAITLVWLNTNGTSAFYPNVIQVDGQTSGVTVRWQGGSAPTTGNASSIDAYVFTLIKTANATFTILASQTRFA
jgi:hypothetical protein